MKIYGLPQFSYIFYLGEKQMRIILDTDKKTITVPWNYQQKLDDINRIIMEVSNDESISTNCGVSASRILTSVL